MSKTLVRRKPNPASSISCSQATPPASTVDSHAKTYSILLTPEAPSLRRIMT